ncbi:MAG TPA: nucleotidyltransferase, partial [Acidimicrobiaceae bacterium]|nr:nucleotidyltransferase [Acidimicrobiaceae bacterium]
MAGGLGSRFGGDKQLVDVGPNGETFLDYAIRDALAAGIGSVVVVARTDLDALLRDHLARQHGPDLPLT